MLKPYTNYNCQSTLHQWFTIELTKKRLLLKHVFLSSWLCRVSCKEINKNHCLCNCWVDTCDKDLRKKIRDADTLALSTTWKGEDAQSACEWQRVSREKKKMNENDWEEKMRRLSEKNGWIFIAITGCTNSGKSTVAKRLTETVLAQTVNQDIFFRVCLFL